MKQGTLPAKWNDIKHKKGDPSREGTHDHDIHPEYDDAMKPQPHTHCCECGDPFETTKHFFGNGIICDKCTLKMLKKDETCEDSHCIVHVPLKKMIKELEEKLEK